jgi:predicted protein tyrosine phosphatase
MIVLARAWDAERVATEIGTSWRVVIDDPPREGPFRPIDQSGNQLHLRFDDAVTTSPGVVLAQEDQIAALIEYADRWGGTAPLVVNCYAGTSRSPAAILIMLARLYPGREREIVDGVRAAGPHIRPNPHVIALGDRLLRANGRLVNAKEAMRPASVRGFSGQAEIPFDGFLPRVGQGPA